jgi:hypothetical protein
MKKKKNFGPLTPLESHKGEHVPFVNYLGPEAPCWRVSFNNGDVYEADTEEDLTEIFKAYNAPHVLCSSDVDYALDDFGIDARAIVGRAIDNT